MADESTAVSTASEEYLAVLPKEPEVTLPAALQTIESPESVSAIEAGADVTELVSQEITPTATQSDADDYDIVAEPVPKVGFVKRWTRKIVGWVKRVFKWRKG